MKKTPELQIIVVPVIISKPGVVTLRSSQLTKSNSRNSWNSTKIGFLNEPACDLEMKYYRPFAERDFFSAVLTFEGIESHK